MTPITKFEERVALTQLTGVCIPRIRLFEARGWVYRIWPNIDAIPTDDEVEF